ncbi:hypothetical protein WISP_68084 [Willisornis vidua]|uniref:Uncharacterized protein n=1 Tax=Willisornis vidua TaxID=1566151 RepID=A0ABQ9D901_9PASS|nr:hypothetical protein WISP_68084 [Willisornis vidua]
MAISKDEYLQAMSMDCPDASRRGVVTDESFVQALHGTPGDFADMGDQEIAIKMPGLYDLEYLELTTLAKMEVQMLDLHLAIHLGDCSYYYIGISPTKCSWLK